jgi:putative transposase
LDDRDHLGFLGIVRDTLNRYAWRCLTYCLMPNHYHLIMETLKPNLSQGMRQINGVYAQRFNRRHDRCGHLFQGRFGATLIGSDEYMLAAIRYVALNPVRAGLSAVPEDWKWSGHAELLGRSPVKLVASAEVLAHFGPKELAVETYSEFVSQGEQNELRHPLQPIAGRMQFIEQHLPPEPPSGEVPIRAWREKGPELAALLNSDDRDAAIVRAYESGYRMKEIADVLGCHYATVSRRIRRFETCRSEAT